MFLWNYTFIRHSLLYIVHSNLRTCPSHALRKDYGSKFSVGTMSFPGGYHAEINTLVDTFIFRYKLSHEVAAKLVKCSLGIQWQVISPRAPKVVHKPNGFVMGRILKAEVFTGGASFAVVQFCSCDAY